MADKTGTGIHPSYLTDDRLSLEAKGLLAIISNNTYEHIIRLEHCDPSFDRSLTELKHFGYIGQFDADIFEVRLSPSNRRKS